MKPIDKYLHKPKSFWAGVRSLSQHIGYSRGNTIIIPSCQQMVKAFSDLGLDSSKICADSCSTQHAKELHNYFFDRAAALTNIVAPNLMSAEEAKTEFEKLSSKFNFTCSIPFNKQKAEKRAPAFLTGLVNMMIEKHARGMNCDYDPRKLTTFTRNGSPLRTLSRRVDGAFPCTVNPVAIWEIKEYYYTTTFGSRVADGVYETLLDGMEIEELKEHENIDVKHYLIVDARDTWWEKGKAYLCRMFDMLHMGYVDEILFGREVLSEIPRIVNEWIKLTENRGQVGLPE